MLIILLILFLIIKIIIQYFPCFVFITDPSLKDAVYVLLRDVFIGLMCLTVLAVVRYYDDFDWNAIDVVAALYASLLTLFLYAFLGIILTFIA